MVSSFFVLYTLAFLQKEGGKKVLRDTCQSITYYFAKYHVILAKVSLDAFLGFIFLLTFSLAYLLYLSFFIAQKDTFLIFYL